MKGLIFLLQTLNSLKYFFNFHLIFQPALHFFDLMHQVHLSLIFKLQNTIDKLLLNLMPHDQKENQFHHLRNILQVHQFMLAASFELQILHLVQIFFNFEQVLLVIKVAFIDVGEEMRVDLEEQNWNESGCPQLVEGIYAVLFSYEQSLLVKPNQQVMVVLVVITHLLQSQPMPKYSLKPKMPSVNTYNINNQAEINHVDSLCIDNQVSIEEIEINMQFVIVINVMSIQQVDYPDLLSQDSLFLSLVGLNTIIICFSKIRHSSHTFQSLTGKFDLGTFLTVQKLQYTVYGSQSQSFDFS